MEQDSKSGRGYDVKRDVWEWVESIAISVTTLIFIFVFVFRIVGVDGHSMDQTLADGDRLIITSMFYTPAAGDIVVVNQPNEFGKPLIKRIIALEGQTVDIDFKTGVVTVDGQVLDEPYISTPTTVYEGVDFPVTVPEGTVFVMGDNRQNSTDSRSEMVGFIDTRYILGKAIFRIFPFNTFGLLS
ncbi:MAG: signal peptidase I [Clostridiales bacterium]|nr:MAG: signal peptidase I [Clostridiales bacterium]